MILVTVDASPASETALPTAIELATRFDRPVRVLLVLDGALTHHFREAGRGNETTTEVAIAEYLDAIAARLRQAGVERVDLTFRYGTDAATEIVNAADPNDVALLVMATHGRSGVSRWLTGSVAERVIRSSQVPVVVVPTPPDDDGQS